MGLARLGVVSSVELLALDVLCVGVGVLKRRCRGFGPGGVLVAALRVDVAEFPTGTVTFLFTDLVSSSRLWEEQPAAMRAALARHDAILAEAVA
jgi:class 3 adenylate cyclase